MLFKLLFNCVSIQANYVKTVLRRIYIFLICVELSIFTFLRYVNFTKPYFFVHLFKITYKVCFLNTF